MVRIILVWHTCQSNYFNFNEKSFILRLIYIIFFGNTATENNQNKKTYYKFQRNSNNKRN